MSHSILNWRRFTRAWVLPSSVIRRSMALILGSKAYEEKYAAPIASSVDRFFVLYSLYLELLVADPGYGQPFAKVRNFPWGMTLFIARDEPLMEQVLAGRFDFLANNDQDGLGWLQRLRAARLLMAGNLDPR